MFPKHYNVQICATLWQPEKKHIFTLVIKRYCLFLMTKTCLSLTEADHSGTLSWYMMRML